MRILFEKYVHGHTKKKEYSKLENKPLQYQNTAEDNLPSLIIAYGHKILCE